MAKTSSSARAFNRAVSMETETVKLLKALPNMLRKVMPTVVVATKYSQGKKDLGDPYPMAPFGFEFGFYYFIFLRCPSGILWDLIT